MERGRRRHSHTDSETEEPLRKRRRAKIACGPCRERKRKCDGRLPCNTCTAFDYECYPVPSPTARRKHVKVLASSASPSSDPAVAVAAPSGSLPLSGSVSNAHVQSLEANSGAAFVRNLGLKIDPQNAPRLRLFGWNTGERLAGCAPGVSRPITTLLSRASMMRLSRIFFEKVAIVYGIVDSENLYKQVDRRWVVNGTAHAVDPYDQVLCGVAALGLHFSEPLAPAMEPDLVETARTLLEQSSLSSPPSIDTVVGWVLRVAYLRMTSTPHATWLASCTLMHVAEAARIHQESPAETVFDESPEAVNVEIRRRLWGMAQHFNIWVSFDLGRTQITLPNVTTKPVARTADDLTSHILSLMPLTEVLDPNRTRSTEHLESDLAQLLELVIEEPPAAMAHTNLVLCVYRRLRAQKPGSIQMDKLLNLARRALNAARTMVARYLPWHHVANIPFQIVCLLLAVDSRASLAMLGDALSTLMQVRDAFSSPQLQDAYDTAYLLVMLHQRQKEEDVRSLKAVLEANAVPVPSSGAGTSDVQRMAVGEGSMWLDGLFTTVPSLRDFDLETFLNQDPEFAEFAFP